MSAAAEVSSSLTVLDTEERASIREDCYRDPVRFCQVFLAEHFFLRVPWVHRGLMAILTGRTEFLLRYGELRKIRDNFVYDYDEGRRQIFHFLRSGVELSDSELAEVEASAEDGPLSWEAIANLGVVVQLDLGQFTLIMMPRGSSKTTIAGLAIALYKIAYQDTRFILYVSAAGTHAQGQLESVRKELANNELVAEFFGDLKPERSSEERWSSEKLETITGIAMQYRGKGAKIRGINHNNRRPDFILVDDPQSKEDIRSDTVREEDKKWCFAELLPARERLSKKTTMVFLGTYLGQECIVDVLAQDPRWTTVRIEVQDKDGDWIWPAYMDQDSYDEEKLSYTRAGLLPEFYREYHNEDHEDADLPFKPSFFILEPKIEREEFAFATYADLATSEKRTADFTCITTVGISVKGIIAVVEMCLERGMSEEDKVDEFFRQSLEWGSNFHGFESVAYQAVFEETLRMAMFRKSHYFEIIAVPHRVNKISRIRAALRPPYSGGYVRHRLRWPLYEGQLLDFRYDNSHKHDDGPDAVASAVVLLDPAAAYAAGEDPSESQYRDLDDELGGDWRNAC